MTSPNYMNHPSIDHIRHPRLRRGVAVGAFVLTGIIGLEATTHVVANVSDQIAHINTGGEAGFSDSTHSFPVKSGDGLYDAASTINGINSIDMRKATAYIEHMPENKAVLEDGLQPAEVLTVPDSVK